MKRPSIYKKNVFDVIKSVLMPLVFTAIIILLVLYGLGQAEESSRDEGARVLEDSIRRAVIAAYAIEGRYPATIEHIEENFGVFVDRDRFIVHYMVFGANIMPDVAVIIR